jgi:predicted phosphoadenosine phosphosulfate sulfurtransferase
VLFIRAMYFVMKTYRYRCSFAFTLGLHPSTLHPAMCGCFSEATSTTCVVVLRLICKWEFRPPTTNFVGLPVTLTETQRKAAINSKFQYGREPRELEDWLEAQPQRVVMLGVNADSYDAVIWVTSQFSRPLNNWWLNREHQAAIYFF